MKGVREFMVLSLAHVTMTSDFPTKNCRALQIPFISEELAVSGWKCFCCCTVLLINGGMDILKSTSSCCCDIKWVTRATSNQSLLHVRTVQNDQSTEYSADQSHSHCG